MRAARAALCAASLCAGALALVGCAGRAAPKPAAERLRREDLIAVSRALMTPEHEVVTELAAAKAAWPHVANGLPADTAAIPRMPIQAAAQSAARVPLPALFQEAQAATLTGPASSIAGLFRTYQGLSARGWQMIGAQIDQIEHGSPTAARFARQNVALYIDSVYDGHFVLAQIGKKILAAYKTLGGPAGFGGALTQAEVEALAAFYSEADDRLQPHPGVRLGS
jgi:hypothetical protein